MLLISQNRKQQATNSMQQILEATGPWCNQKSNEQTYGVAWGICSNQEKKWDGKVSAAIDEF